jgi:hypothetical protein
MGKKVTKKAAGVQGSTKASRALRMPPAASVASVANSRLLSGGNPQIAKADGDAPVQAYIAAMPGWKSGLGHRLDALITAAVPGVRKAVRWNSPFYGVEGKGWFLGFHCLTKYVKVAFFKGAALSPGLEGTPKSGQVRYLDIHEGEGGGEFDEARFVAWVKEASRIEGWDGSSPS